MASTVGGRFACCRAMLRYVRIRHNAMVAIAMAAKKKPLNLTVGKDVRDGMERAAKAERSTISALADRILANWLATQGYLKPEVKP
jgi:hypothetical protein